jgi:hypothetical protein
MVLTDILFQLTRATIQLKASLGVKDLEGAEVAAEIVYQMTNELGELSEELTAVLDERNQKIADRKQGVTP